MILQGSQFWSMFYQGTPAENFPCIRDLPTLRPESIAQNTPLDADGHSSDDDDRSGGQGGREGRRRPGGGGGGGGGTTRGHGGFTGRRQGPAPRQTTTPWEDANYWNQNNQTQGPGGSWWRSATMCARCASLSGEPVCSKCGVDIIHLTPVRDPEAELSHIKHTLVDDTSIGSPNKRHRTILETEFQIKQLRDILRSREVMLRDEDSMDSMGPEFQTLPSLLRGEISAF
ncbi:hypothetical protein RRF57_001815 [Xylaria bambusicola]|uniref:Uncharacterized protein n=1 Tax=Xylaria bambusicola TaxID=326684 RepID=A0AAN7U5G9_9PEZI